MEGLTWFDLTVGGLMLISGLLALSRGFTREITSLVAWGAAGVAALVAVLTPELVAQAEVYIKQPLVAKIALGAGVFLIVLIILSVISIRFTDWLLDSSPGAFDRTLGFFYGLARGLVLVVIAYIFYIWFIPEGKRFEAVRTARSLQPVETVSIGLIDMLEGRMLSNEMAEIIRSKTYRFAREESNANPSANPNSSGKTNGAAPDNSGLKRQDKKVLDQLIDNAARPAN